MKTIERRAYAEMYGPTVGDRVRLGDTDADRRDRARPHHLRRGGEVRRRQGDPRRDGAEPARRRGGRRHRSSPTPSSSTRAASSRPTSASRSGRISGIGKAGNPDVQPGVDIVIGPGTEIIAGEGCLLTAGGIDSHIHFISPQQCEDALMSGVTTMLGGGTGPAAGTNATTCTPGPWNVARMLQAAEALPMNLGFLGKGNASRPEALDEQILAGLPGPQAARGLGHDAGRDRLLPVRRRDARRAGRHPHRHAQRVGLRRGHAGGVQGPRHPHATTPRARAAATRPTSSRPCGVPTRAALVDQPDAAVHRQHASTSTWTC